MNTKLENHFLEKLELIAKKHKLDLFILFGSRAKGTAKKTSDYDLAINRKTDLTLKEKRDLEEEISKALNHADFDLIIIDELTPPVLKMQIIKEGMVIFCQNRRYFENLKDNIYFDYVDSKALLEPTKEKFLAGEI